MRQFFPGVALVAASLIAPTPVRAQNADAIIDRAVAAYGRLTSMRAEFRQTLTNPLTGSTQTTTGVILRKKPNLLSIDFASGDRVAADGSTLWVYLPSSTPGQVMRMPYSGGNATALSGAGISRLATLAVPGERSRYGDGEWSRHPRSDAGPETVQRESQKRQGMDR